MMQRFATPWLVVLALVGCQSDEGASVTGFLIQREVSTPSTAGVVVNGNCAEAASEPFDFAGPGRVVGDDLEISVHYSGGCRQHEFSLCWSGSLSGDGPPTAEVRILHSSGHDVCARALSYSLRLPLGELRQVATAQNAGASGMRLHVTGFNPVQQFSTNYEFQSAAPGAPPVTPGACNMDGVCAAPEMCDCSDCSSDPGCAAPGACNMDSVCAAPEMCDCSDCSSDPGCAAPGACNMDSVCAAPEMCDCSDCFSDPGCAAP